MADLSITASQVVPAGNPNTYSAGAAITAGQTVYVSGGTAYLADCDNTSTTAGMRGIAVCSAASGQKVVVQSSGTIVIGAAASITEGTVFVLSDTAGGIKPVADLASGDYVTYIGVGDDSNGIVLNIHASGVQVPA